MLTVRGNGAYSLVQTGKKYILWVLILVRVPTIFLSSGQWDPWRAAGIQEKPKGSQIPSLCASLRMADTISNCVLPIAWILLLSWLYQTRKNCNAAVDSAMETNALKLARGLFPSHELFDWFTQLLYGKIQKTHGQKLRIPARSTERVPCHLACMVGRPVDRLTPMRHTIRDTRRRGKTA